MQSHQSGKFREKSSVFSRRLNVDKELDQRTSSDRVFQTHVAAIGKTRSPTVDSSTSGRLTCMKTMTVVAVSTAGPWCSVDQQTGTPEQVRADTNAQEQQSCSRFAAAPTTSEGLIAEMKGDHTCLPKRRAMPQHSGLTEVCSVRGQASRRVLRCRSRVETKLKTQQVTGEPGMWQIDILCILSSAWGLLKASALSNWSSPIQQH